MVNKPGRPRGRPAGPSAVRVRLLRAAHEALDHRPTGPITARGLARQVGVSHTLVNYHFGSLDGLLTEALALRIAPDQVVRAAVSSDGQLDVAELMHGLLLVWEEPATQGRYRDLARRIAAEPDRSRSLVDCLERAVFGQLAHRVGRRRAQQITVVLVGAIFSRYVLGVESATAGSAREFEQNLVHLLGGGARRQPS